MIASKGSGDWDQRRGKKLPEVGFEPTNPDISRAAQPFK